MLLASKLRSLGVKPPVTLPVASKVDTSSVQGVIEKNFAEGFSFIDAVKCGKRGADEAMWI